MTIEIKMPALSPTMEKGIIAKWLVKEGDIVSAGDVLAEIETDKATMEFEASDDGQIAKLLVAEGTDEVTVGTVIALIASEIGAEPPKADAERPLALVAAHAETMPAVDEHVPPKHDPIIAAPRARLADKVKISPLAMRIAEAKHIDLSGISGTGPGGRIVKSDLGLETVTRTQTPAAAMNSPPAFSVPEHSIPEVPHELVKLSSMRKIIARRLTESKQQIPHIYLTVDIALDPLLKLRAELNDALGIRGIKLSVNDFVIKALALALTDVPQCNVQFAGDHIARFKRADISVAVSIPNGLITPVVKDAGNKSLSAIATEMKDLAARARDGKLQPVEYQGGTASLSNLGMYGIKQFEAVINPPQAMIMAVGAGEKRAIIQGEAIQAATIMCATGSFDHRAIDGADAAVLMRAFKQAIESPQLLVA